MRIETKITITRKQIESLFPLSLPENIQIEKYWNNNSESYYFNVILENSKNIIYLNTHDVINKFYKYTSFNIEDYNYDKSWWCFNRKITSIDLTIIDNN